MLSMLDPLCVIYYDSTIHRPSFLFILGMLGILYIFNILSMLLTMPLLTMQYLTGKEN
jgi:hypothetical protein